MKHIH